MRPHRGLFKIVRRVGATPPTPEEVDLARQGLATIFPDGSLEVHLTGGLSPSLPIRRGFATNQLEFSCAGSVLTLSINGVLLSSVDDESFDVGTLGIVALPAPVDRNTPPPPLVLTADARFDNLVVAAATPPGVGARAPAPPAGTVLLEDNFDDPTAGWLSDPLPAAEQDYINGEYAIRKVDPDWRFFPTAALPGRYGDASLAVDARVSSEPDSRFVALECRKTPAGGYAAFIERDRGKFWLTRWDGQMETFLTGHTPSRLLRRAGAANRIELACAGSTISLAINGTRVAAVRDDTHVEGQLALGAGKFEEADGAAEAHFDNLVVRAPPIGSEELLRPETPPAGTVLLADDFDNVETGWLPRSTASPADVRVGYAAGEYFIAGSAGVSIPGSYRDAALTVHGRLVGETRGRVIFLGCRAAPGRADVGYGAAIEPEGRVGLYRSDGVSEGVGLTELAPASAIHRGTEANRFELTCSGDAIVLAVNGTKIASARDATYQEGEFGFGLNQSFGPDGVTEARFDNLIVTQAPR